MNAEHADEARRMRECVDATLKVVEDMLDLAKHEYGHSIDEAMLHIRAQFEKRAMRVLNAEDQASVRADYANYCAVLVALSESRARARVLEDQVKFRDSVINILGELDSL
jgi:hypothetical protein